MSVLAPEMNEHNKFWNGMGGTRRCWKHSELAKASKILQTTNLFGKTLLSKLIHIQTILKNLKSWKTFVNQENLCQKNLN